MSKLFFRNSRPRSAGTVPQPSATPTKPAEETGFDKQSGEVSGKSPALTDAALELLPAQVSPPRGWWEREPSPEAPVEPPPQPPSPNGGSTRPSLLFDRWPRFASAHPWPVLGVAIAVLIGFGALFFTIGGEYGTSGFSLPGTESQRLNDLLAERFPESSGEPARVVLSAPAGLDDPAVRLNVDALLADFAELPQVTGVSSPYEEPGAISPGGTIARVTVQYEALLEDLKGSSVDALMDFRRERSTEDLQVEIGGSMAWAAEEEPPGSAELSGLAAAIIILLIAFGSVVAMGLPILVAIFALASGSFLTGVAASFIDLPDFTPQFAAMIGIGVGIDYALLIVTRYREALSRGKSVEDAIVEAVSTAGRAVIFAGTTVVIALLGLWAVGIPFIGYIGSAAALVVALSVVVAIFVLPAALGLVGRRIDSWRVPGLSPSAPDSEVGMGYRLSRLVQSAPWLSLIVSLGILLALAAPVLAIRLGSSDSSSNPTSLTSRRSYDLLSEGFGPGFNGPILIGVAIDDPAALAAVEQLPARIEQEAGIAGVSPPQFNEASTAATIIVIPDSSPQSVETESLVHRLREVVPASLDDTSATALIGGSTAAFIDIGNRISSRLVFFFGAVIGLSFILLMVVFRSILIPLKAAFMNLLSIAAAYGVLVAIFQWGWFAGPLGVEGTGPIESFLPMMLFALLFGLSMDYEVFLVSRIQEEYLISGNNTEAVARGLSVTTRVISTAAAIMVAVFLAFAFSDQRVIKEAGIGLATAIFLDATLVRLVLVPSIMQLLGDKNWWLPGPLERFIPHIGLRPPQELAPVEIETREAPREAAAGGG